MLMYYWMHRNKLCTKITVDLETSCVFFTNYTNDILLRAFGDKSSPVSLQEWFDLLETRVAPVRDASDRLASQNMHLSKNPTTEDLIHATCGVLVDDFFWIWQAGTTLPDYMELRQKYGLCRQPMAKDVLRQHRFTDTEMYGYPSMITRASQPKWVYEGWLIKKDRWGYEAIVEELIYEMAKCTEGINCLEYITLPKIDKRGVCAMPIITDEKDMEFVPLWDVIRKSGHGKDILDGTVKQELLHRVIKIVKDVTGVEIGDYLRKMLIWDALILNTDRHYNNMAVARNAYGHYCLIPFYDHGLSLLSGSTPENLNGVKARVFGRTFDDYIETAGQDMKLTIDIDGFMRKVIELGRNYGKGTEYHEIFAKVRTILIARLLATQGKLWQPKGNVKSWIRPDLYQPMIESIDEQMQEWKNEQTKEHIEDLRYGKH